MNKPEYEFSWSLRRNIAIALAIAAIVASCGGSAQALVPYHFEAIARTGGLFARFPGYRVGLNDNGDVAFAADLRHSGMGVFVYSRGIVTQIDFADEEFRYFEPPAINTHGTAVYEAQRRDGSQAILRYSGGARSILADSDDPRVGFFGPMSLTDNDRTAFVESYWLDDAGPGELHFGYRLFSAEGTTDSLVEDTVGPFSRIGYASINEHGDIVFGGEKDNGDYGAFLLTQDQQVNSTSNISSFGGALMSINDHRQVAFHGNTPANDQAVFVWQEDSLVTLADGSGPFDYVGFPDINDIGQVVFDAGIDNFGPRGLFTGPDAVDDLVVRAGQVLDGAVIRDFIAYPQINNRGQIAFITRMADGSERIFLATPIPEPSTVMLLLATICAVLGSDRWAVLRRGEWFGK